MARIRTIKPEFFLHDELFELERETGLPVRLAFIGLWTQCDREGRFKWRPLRLKAAVLPYDDVDMSRVLHALNTRGFLVKYRCGTDEYGVIPSFKNHQVINNKESKTELPSLSDGEIINPAIGAGSDAKLTREYRVDDANQGEGKEGREKERKELNTLSDSNRTAESEPDRPPAQKKNGSASVDGNQDSEFAGAGGNPDTVETAFEEIFWGAGLRKDAKTKAKAAFRTKYREWKKTTHGTPEEFAQMLASDIRLRLQAFVFGFDRLLPTSYLNGERWNDEKPSTQGQGDAPAGGIKPFVYNDPESAEVFIDYDAMRSAMAGSVR
ncbi:hypothetical protein [Dickeya sp. ws52]|uniref:hypothetical protein n=1 Tax=Dickeya sp. ws52 TaxID=2576377 RepID=UPI00117F9B05|nr:hypothetical protein [Dickeya sp. ws52]TYL43923.1 hypothetical protein FDP13_03720 [Dickeya sp. ws52]